MLVVVAILIAIASLVVSHFLTRDLSRQEHDRMEVWAEAMRSLSHADENTDLSLVLKVLNGNNTIPVIVMDRKGHVSDFRNVEVSAKDAQDSLRLLTDIGQQFKSSGRSIRISLNDVAKGDYIDVCYGESLMLTRLAYYPFVQLGVVLLFVVYFLHWF